MVKGSKGVRLALLVDKIKQRFGGSRLGTETGARMLYFLGQLGESLTAFNVFRYITFRTAGAVVTALFFVFLFGPRHDRRPAHPAGQGPADPRGRPAGPPADQEGHAHHGRPDDPRRRGDLDPALVEPQQRLCLGGAVRHRQLRRHRLLRRLPQGQADVAQGLLGLAAARHRGRGRADRRLRHRLGHRAQDRDSADVPVHQGRRRCRSGISSTSLPASSSSAPAIR